MQGIQERVSEQKGRGRKHDLLMSHDLFCGKNLKLLIKNRKKTVHAVQL